MANYVIVGAGAAGLYTAYRLLQSNTLKSSDTLVLYEWSGRPGGRILTYTFPGDIGQNTGLYSEFGGMRFAADPSWNPPTVPNPANLTQGHLLVQNMIINLGLGPLVVPFLESPSRMYYLRGNNVYENQLTSLSVLPQYNFNPEFQNFVQNNLLNIQSPQTITSDNLLGAIASLFAPGLTSSNADRPKWCNYFANGLVPGNVGTTAFPAGTSITDIGYWNMLYDQFGDEGFDYSADGAGYTSNVINWNSADAMQANNDYGSGVQYMRINGGYGQLFMTLAQKILGMAPKGSGIQFGQQLVGLQENLVTPTTTCTFANTNQPDSPTYTVSADTLFLAMPRRSLELVAAGSPGYMLNNPQVKYYLESSIDQPAMKVIMVFNSAWWTSPQCVNPPQLTQSPYWPQGVPVTQWVGGPTITDLPLRMIYYFANNVPAGPGPQGGPYVLLASYDDMNYADFWRQMEITGNYTVAPSLIGQPLYGPTPVDVNGPFASILMKQLAEVHGMSVADIPPPAAVYYQDWGQDPFGGGYHGWAPHYNICQMMDYIRAPYSKILNNQTYKTYIVGSCYSFDQAWVEGAFCVAESVLQEFLGLPAFNGISNYQLVCSATANPKAKQKPK